MIGSYLQQAYQPGLHWDEKKNPWDMSFLNDMGGLRDMGPGALPNMNPNDFAAGQLSQQRRSDIQGQSVSTPMGASTQGVTSMFDDIWNAGRNFIGGVAGVPNKIAEMFGDAQAPIDPTGLFVGNNGRGSLPMTGAQLAGKALLGLTGLDQIDWAKTSEAWKKKADEAHIDKQSVAYTLGNMTGNVALMATTAGLGETMIGPEVAAGLGELAQSTKLGQFMFGTEEAGGVGARLIAGSLAASTTNLVNEYDRVKSGEMTLGEYLARSAANAPLGMVGTVGRNTLEETGRVLPFIAKNAAVGGVTGALQTGAIESGSKIYRDATGQPSASWGDIAESTGMGALYGTLGGAALSAMHRPWKYKGNLPEVMPDNINPDEVPVPKVDVPAVAQEHNVNYEEVPHEIPDEIPAEKLSAQVANVIDFMETVDKVHESNESAKIVSKLEEAYAEPRKVEENTGRLEPIQDWTDRVIAKALTEGSLEDFQAKAQAILQDVLPGNAGKQIAAEIKVEPDQTGEATGKVVDQGIAGEPVADPVLVQEFKNRLSAEYKGQGNQENRSAIRSLVDEFKSKGASDKDIEELALDHAKRAAVKDLVNMPNEDILNKLHEIEGKEFDAIPEAEVIPQEGTPEGQDLLGETNDAAPKTIAADNPAPTEIGNEPPASSESSQVNPAETAPPEPGGTTAAPEYTVTPRPDGAHDVWLGDTNIGRIKQEGDVWVDPDIEGDVLGSTPEAAAQSLVDTWKAGEAYDLKQKSQAENLQRLKETSSYNPTVLDIPEEFRAEVADFETSSREGDVLPEKSQIPEEYKEVVDDNIEFNDVQKNDQSLSSEDVTTKTTPKLISDVVKAAGIGREELVVPLTRLSKIKPGSDAYMDSMLEVEKLHERLQDNPIAAAKLEELLADRIQRDYIRELAAGVNEDDLIKSIKNEYRRTARAANQESGAKPGDENFVTPDRSMSRLTPTDPVPLEELAATVGKNPETLKALKATDQRLYSDVFGFQVMKNMYNFAPAAVRPMLVFGAGRLGTEFMDDDKMYGFATGRQWKNFMDAGMIASTVAAGGHLAYTKTARWAGIHTPAEKIAAIMRPTSRYGSGGAMFNRDLLTAVQKINSGVIKGEGLPPEVMTMKAEFTQTMKALEKEVTPEMQAKATAVEKAQIEVLRKYAVEGNRVTTIHDLTMMERANPVFAEFMKERDRVIGISRSINANIEDAWNAFQGELPKEQVAIIRNYVKDYKARVKAGEVPDQVRADLVNQIERTQSHGVAREFEKASKGQDWNVKPKRADIEYVHKVVYKVFEDINDKIFQKVDADAKIRKANTTADIETFNASDNKPETLATLPEATQKIIQSVLDKRAAKVQGTIEQLIPVDYDKITPKEWNDSFDAHTQAVKYAWSKNYAAKIEETYFKDKPELYQKFKEVRAAHDMLSDLTARQAQARILGMADPNPAKVPKAMADFVETYSAKKADFDQKVSDIKGMDKTDPSYAGDRQEIRSMRSSLTHMQNKMKEFKRIEDIRTTSPQRFYVNTERGFGEGGYVLRWGRTDDDPGYMKKFKSKAARESWYNSPEGKEARLYAEANPLEKTTENPMAASDQKKWIYQRTPDAMEKLARFQELAADVSSDSPASQHQRLSDLIDGIENLPPAFRREFIEVHGRAKDLMKKSSSSKLTMDEMNSLAPMLDQTIKDGLAIFNGYGPSKHFETRTGVKGWMPKDDFTKLANETHAMMQHEIADGYGKAALQNLYHKELFNVQELGLMPQYQDFLKERLDQTVSPKHKFDGEKQWKISNTLRSGISTSLMWLATGAGTKNKVDAYTNAIPQLQRVQMDLYGKSVPSIVLAGRLLKQQLASEIQGTIGRFSTLGHYSNDMRKVFEDLAGQHAFEAQFTKHTISGERLLEPLMKKLDGGLWISNMVEGGNRKMAGMAAAKMALDAGLSPSDATQIAHETIRTSQGDFASDAMTKLEYQANSNPYTSMLMPLFAAATRSSAHLFSFAGDYMRNPGTFKFAKTLAPLAAMVTVGALLRGWQNMPGTGDVLNVYKGYKWLMDAYNGNPPAILKESGEEKWRRDIIEHGVANGYGANIPAFLYDNFKEGYLSILTNRNLQSDQTITGMFPTVLFSRVAALTSIMAGQTEEAHVIRLAKTLSPQLGRMIKGSMEFEKGTYLGEKGEDLHRPYNAMDFLGEVTLGRQLKDYQALERDYTHGGYMIGTADAKAWVDNLNKIPKFDINPKFANYLSSDVKAANDLRYSLLKVWPTYADMAELDKQSIEKYLKENPTGQKILAMRTTSFDNQGKVMQSFGSNKEGEAQFIQSAKGLVDRYYSAVTFLDATSDLRSKYGAVAQFYGTQTPQTALMIPRDVIFMKWLIGQAKGEIKELKSGTENLPK